jgi:hypothetical protein
MAHPSVTIASLALCYAGLTGLCLAMGRHHQKVLQRQIAKGRALGFRAAGWALLTLSLVACVIGWGASVGVVVWFGVLSAAALIIIVLLPYAPLVIARAGASAAAVGVVTLTWVVLRLPP